MCIFCLATEIYVGVLLFLKPFQLLYVNYYIFKVPEEPERAIRKEKMPISITAKMKKPPAKGIFKI